MKRVIGWMMMLIALIAVVVMYAHLMGIAQTLLMFLILFLSWAWIVVATVLIKSGNDKKGTDNEEEEVGE